jgi:CBS domain-containing protein
MGRNAMEGSMKVRDVMTAPVVTVGPETELAAATGVMAERRISGLPVVDRAGRLIGMLTEGDLLRRVETGTQGETPGFLKTLFRAGSVASDYVRTHARKVEEIMTPDVVTVGPDEDLAEVVALMRRRRIRRVPVVADGHLVGIVSRADLIRALGEVLKASPDKPEGDAAIRTAILAELASQAWAPRGGIRIEVTKGVATIDGVVFSDEERRAILVAAENVPGVTKVQDQLVWVDPSSGMSVGADGRVLP